MFKIHYDLSEKCEGFLRRMNDIALLLERWYSWFISCISGFDMKASQNFLNEIVNIYVDISS